MISFTRFLAEAWTDTTDDYDRKNVQYYQQRASQTTNPGLKKSYQNTVAKAKKSVQMSDMMKRRSKINPVSEGITRVGNQYKSPTGAANDNYFKGSYKRLDDYAKSNRDAYPDKSHFDYSMGVVKQGIKKSLALSDKMKRRERIKVVKD